MDHSQNMTSSGDQYGYVPAYDLNNISNVNSQIPGYINPAKELETGFSPAEFNDYNNIANMAPAGDFFQQYIDDVGRRSSNDDAGKRKNGSQSSLRKSLTDALPNSSDELTSIPSDADFHMADAETSVIDPKLMHVATDQQNNDQYVRVLSHPQPMRGWPQVNLDLDQHSNGHQAALSATSQTTVGVGWQQQQPTVGYNTHQTGGFYPHQDFNNGQVQNGKPCSNQPYQQTQQQWAIENARANTLAQQLENELAAHYQTKQKLVTLQQINNPQGPQEGEQEQIAASFGPPNAGKAPPKKKHKNKRSENIAKFKPGEHYDQQFPYIMPSWMGRKTGTEFNYNEYGELDSEMKLTPEQFNDFLTGRRRGQEDGVENPQEAVALWVQCVPADGAKRYPTAKSSTCRFVNCPVQGNTIKKGEFRICIDEWAGWAKAFPRKDPYHNAGYAHLFCFEKNFSIKTMLAGVKIQPDTRYFSGERNRMAVNRDHPSMQGIVEDHIQNRWGWPVDVDAHYGDYYERQDDWYEFSLCKALTEEHLSKAPAVRARERARREEEKRQNHGGLSNTIDQHLNNLDMMAVIRAQQPPRSQNVGKVRAVRKRKRSDESDEDSDDEDKYEIDSEESSDELPDFDALNEVDSPKTRPARARAGKRQRMDNGMASLTTS